MDMLKLKLKFYFSILLIFPIHMKICWFPGSVRAKAKLGNPVGPSAPSEAFLTSLKLRWKKSKGGRNSKRLPAWR
jgi:hypothetical protein